MKWLGAYAEMASVTLCLCAAGLAFVSAADTILGSYKGPCGDRYTTYPMAVMFDAGDATTPEAVTRRLDCALAAS